MSDLTLARPAARAERAAGAGVLLLYSATIFLNAALLFFAEPMFARMVLPLLGGSPAVWNTALLFYQGALLAGYGYAHLSTTWLPVRRQALLHLGVLLLPLLVLPIAVPAGQHPPSEANPIPWLLALMCVTVGLPFFALSTGSAVLQRWFAASGHRAAADPYFLYAASNLGSMLALVAYPALVEPSLRLKEQSALWSGGYVGLLVLTGLCALALRRAPALDASAVSTLQSLAAAGCDDRPVDVRRRLRWIGLAFVPSSLMLGVTAYLSTDIAAVPLLWVVPLALYLLSFILAFARRQVVPAPFWGRAFPVLLVPLVLMLAMRASEPMAALLPLHLLTFFSAAMVCHGALAKDRPAARHLTGFYFWISLGGALGGVFNALLAPLLFRGVVEYPLALVLACLCLPYAAGERKARLWDWLAPAALGMLTTVLVLGAQQLHFTGGQLPLVLVFGLPVTFCYLLSSRPVRFGLGVAGILLAAALWGGEQGRLLHAERSFFGVHRVTLDPTGRFHQLVHGSTLHGRQSVDPARENEPLTYYSRSGPIGQLFEARREEIRSVGVVGLGVGTLAAYGEPHQRWTYYEIDPSVRHIAEDRRYFTFLAQCRAPMRIVMGDARLSLAAAPDAGYDLLVLDAYSSDSVPVHLVTREALQLYFRKLAPGGVLAFHISNQHLDLEPVLANLARDAGAASLNQEDGQVSPELEAEGKTRSQWLLMARRRTDFGTLLRDVRWQPAEGRPALGVWTDDFSSLFRVFLWR